MRVAGRLSPSRGPSPQPSPIQGEGVALLFLAPLLKPRTQRNQKTHPRGGCLYWHFFRRLSPSQAPGEAKLGRNGHERDLVRPGQGQGMSLARTH